MDSLTNYRCKPNIRTRDFRINSTETHRGETNTILNNCCFVVCSWLDNDYGSKCKKKSRQKSVLRSLWRITSRQTAKNLQVFFYNLAKNPDKQEILRKEILDVLGDSGVVDAKALSKMPYLKYCLKESFRLNYPTVAGTMRILPKDIVASGYNIPAGTTVLLSNQRAAKKYFEDPDKFIPERWMRADDGRKQDNTNSMAVIPFGHGPRNCIGRRFAVQEIYLATSKVLQKLKIELEPESWNTEFIYTTFIDTEKPIRFKFTNIQ